MIMTNRPNAFCSEQSEIQAWHIHILKNGTKHYWKITKSQQMKNNSKATVNIKNVFSALWVILSEVGFAQDFWASSEKV